MSSNSVSSSDYLNNFTVLDNCYDEVTLNEQVYFSSCQEIVLSSLNGMNGTIFMYGQTGAGKTFTMLGDD